MLFTVLAVLVWSGINPESYKVWMLEVSPAAAGILLLLALYRKFSLTTLSYLILAVLCITMFIGGHYIYSKVPLFDWFQERFDLKRNYYDRFGHLLKGFFIIPIREILWRRVKLKPGIWLAVIGVSISLAIAALYEIAEWVVSMITKGGKASRDFLGTQGDIWDSQWDMSLTLLGSILALLLLSAYQNKFLRKYDK